MDGGVGLYLSSNANLTDLVAFGFFVSGFGVDIGSIATSTEADESMYDISSIWLSFKFFFLSFFLTTIVGFY